MVRVDDDVRDKLIERALALSVPAGRRIPVSDVIRDLLGMEPAPEAHNGKEGQ